MGTLYYGDNLDLLRRYLKDETVDLVDLDPPFKDETFKKAPESNKLHDHQTEFNVEPTKPTGSNPVKPNPTESDEIKP